MSEPATGPDLRDDGAPLAGVRVVEFGHYIAAPAATQVLRDLGAEVVKVEPPLGDQARSIGAYGEGIVLAYNRGKRSVRLDLKLPDDRAAALRLVADADVVVQNLRAGAMARLGLGVADLVAVRPDLVHLSVTGFPSDSPSANRAGLDIAAQAESGIMDLTGERDRDPQRVGFPVADVGASYAVVQAVLAGLFRRERTGRGCVGEVSLLETAVHMQAAMWGEWHVTGQEPRRKGNGQATVAPAADVVDTRDGRVVVSAYAPEHFRRLCTFLDKEWMLTDPRFMDNPARVQHRAELLAEVGSVLGTLSTQECVTRLGDLGLVAAAVRTYADVAASADVEAGDLVVRATDPDGRSFPVPGLPFRIEGLSAPADHTVPRSGEHTDDVLGRGGEG
ncbi:CaiB/BaiF CoA transferase family protein [Nocardioides hwasunensis]|uniref:CoA transferase n=1 Tax=Nocardioides hwasunensis TaxID=397258 RepID=A0ABR8MNK3_9ACTN|nr:CoA transferase [Nocardioides hwasunensis]MBD3916380.1 CoA transferase [Nocardioides hwasunensis]